MLESLDWRVIGLTFNIVGIFFLANSITFARPRRKLHEFFGVERSYPLRSIREHVLNKIQVYIGFTFLIGGFGVQIFDVLDKARKTENAGAIQPNLLTIALILLLSIVLLTVVLKIVQFAWTRVTFKRLLIEFFRENEWDLVKNVHVAKEIGSLLKIPRDRDDSIDDYVSKIRAALHIPGEETAKPKGKTAGTAVRARSEHRETLRASASEGSEKVHPATPPRIG